MAKNSTLRFLLNVDDLLAQNRAQFGGTVMTMPTPPAPTPPTPPAPAPAPAPTPPAPTPAPAPPAPDLGFPQNTPLEQMTTDQREAYWRHHARKHEQRVKDLDNLTPEQLKELRDKAEAHDKAERDRLPEQERLVAEAKEQAKRDALAESTPRLVRAEFKAALTGRVPADQLEARVTAIVDPLDTSKFLTTTGDVDAAKVTAFVDGIQPGKGSTSGPPNHGAGRREGGAGSGVDAGREMFEASRKGRATTTTST